MSTVALMAGRVRLVAFAAVIGVPLTLLLLLATEASGLADLAAWVVALGNLAHGRLAAARRARRVSTVNPRLNPQQP